MGRRVGNIKTSNERVPFRCLATHLKHCDFHCIYLYVEFFSKATGALLTILYLFTVIFLYVYNYITTHLCEGYFNLNPLLHVGGSVLIA